MSTITWAEAPKSVLHMAMELIGRYHQHLEDAKIAFVFRSEGQKRGSMLVLGSTCKVPEKMRPYLDYDFVIWLSERDYDDMTDEERQALIDHELCHCARGRDGIGWRLREHDVQEFAVIIQRHGYWSAALKRIEVAIEEYQQERLPEPLASAEITISGAGRVVSLSGAQLARMAEGIGA